MDITDIKIIPEFSNIKDAKNTKDNNECKVVDKNTSLEDIFWQIKSKKYDNSKEYYEYIKSKLKYLLENFNISFNKYYFIVPTILIFSDKNIELIIKFYNTKIWDLLDLHLELRYGNQNTFGVNIYSHQINEFYLGSLKCINKDIFDNILSYRREIAYKSNYYIPATDLTYNIVKKYKEKSNGNIFEITFRGFYNPDKKLYYFLSEDDYLYCKGYIENYKSNLKYAKDIAEDLLNNNKCKILLDYIDVENLQEFLNNN